MTSKGQVTVTNCPNFSSLLKCIIPIHSGIAWIVQAGILEDAMAMGKLCQCTDHYSPLLHFSFHSKLPSAEGRQVSHSHRTEFHIYLM